MSRKRSLVVTAYGHDKIIDTIAVSSFDEFSGNGYYHSPSPNAETYCDTVNSLELKGDSWVFAKIVSESTQYALNLFRPLEFSDAIMKLDDRAIQKILRETDTQDIVKALKGQDETVQEKIFANMSKRAALLLKEDMEYLGPLRITDVKESREKMLTVIRRLEESGEIVIPNYKGETIE